jgi:hypothetical protein
MNNRSVRPNAPDCYLPEEICNTIRPNVPSLQTCVRLGCLRQGILRGNGHAEPSLIDSSFQVRELARTGLGVVRDHATPAWTIGFGLDAIRVGYTPTCRHEVETLFKYFAAGECQNSVDSIRRKQM